MSKPPETWYDRQALNSKLITYAAMLVLFASIACAVYSAWHAYRAQIAGEPIPDFHMPMFAALAGISVSAFLVGVASIIDLLIVHAEALRKR